MGSRTEPQPQYPWLAEGEAKRNQVVRIFTEIAPTYDRCNRLLSLGQDQKWRNQAVDALQLAPSDPVADLCAGTCDFSAFLHRANQGGPVVSMDLTPGMLEMAAQKPDVSGLLAVGDALCIPLRDCCLAGVTIGWGLRNVTQPLACLKEVARVLRSGGRLAVLETAPSIMMLPLRIWAPIVGRISRRTEAYRYLAESTGKFMDLPTLRQSFESAGFKVVLQKTFMGGAIALTVGEKQ